MAVTGVVMALTDATLPMLVNGYVMAWQLLLLTVWFLALILTFFLDFDLHFGPCFNSLCLLHACALNLHWLDASGYIITFHFYLDVCIVIPDNMIRIIQYRATTTVVGNDELSVVFGQNFIHKLTNIVNITLTLSDNILKRILAMRYWSEWSCQRVK